MRPATDINIGVLDAKRVEIGHVVSTWDADEPHQVEDSRHTGAGQRQQHNGRYQTRVGAAASGGARVRKPVTTDSRPIVSLTP